MIRQEDKAKVRNVKVISSEECVPKHKLLVMGTWFKATKSWRTKFEPIVRVWKLKEEKTCKEYRCNVARERRHSHAVSANSHENISVVLFILQFKAWHTLPLLEMD